MNRERPNDRKIKAFKEGEIDVYVMKSIEYDEYRVELWQKGIHIESADYFTDDKKDAIGTAKQMLITSKVEELIILEEFNENNGNTEYPVTLYKRNNGYIVVYGHHTECTDDIESAVKNFISCCKHARECMGEYDIGDE